jgi:hypothetical protein
VLADLDRGTKIEHLGLFSLDSNQRAPWLISGGIADTLICCSDMFKTKSLYTTCLLVLLLLAPLPATSGNGDSKSQKNIVISLPAETVLASVQKILPLDIPSQSRQLQGDIILESLDRLVIHDNIITVHGVLSGKNLVVVTQLAGQDLQLKVGEIHLPMTCDLQTRFDPAQRKFFVTPRFVDTVQNANNPQDSLTPLLGALGGREYPVDLDALQMITVKIGAKSVPITMEPVKIAGVDNALIFHLLPRVGTPR